MGDIIDRETIGRGLVITIEDYRANEGRRHLADALMAALHLDPKEVAELRVSHHMISALMVRRGDRRNGSPTTRWAHWTLEGKRADDSDEG